jgi:hypothetical protein
MRFRAWLFANLQPPHLIPYYAIANRIKGHGLKLSMCKSNEKEALLIMYGAKWQRRFWHLDGQNGRPTIDECIDLALQKQNPRSQEDLIAYIEGYLKYIVKRCKKAPQ